MERNKAKSRRRARLGLLLALPLLLAAAFFGYVSIYYHADARALAALESDGAVTGPRRATR